MKAKMKRFKFKCMFPLAVFLCCLEEFINTLHSQQLFFLLYANESTNAIIAPCLGIIFPFLVYHNFYIKQFSPFKVDENGRKKYA